MMIAAALCTCCTQLIRSKHIPKLIISLNRQDRETALLVGKNYEHMVHPTGTTVLTYCGTQPQELSPGHLRGGYPAPVKPSTGTCTL